MNNIQKRKNKKNGFVILFAVTISSILLAISLGIADIALREIKFSTSAKDTNDAFLATDTGIEYALLRDRLGDYVPASGTVESWDIVVASSGGTSCAKVNIIKDNTSVTNTTTLITSKGYNMGDVGTCMSSNPDRIERVLSVSY